MQHKIILGAASVALLGAGAFAFPQTTKPQQQGGDKPSATTEHPMTTTSSSHDNKMACNRVSEVIGAKVRNTQREDIGKVEDLIVDPASGRIDYAVLSIDKRGTKDQWYAVPFQKLNVPTSMDRMETGTSGTGSTSGSTGNTGRDDKKDDHDARKDDDNMAGRRMKNPEFVLDLDTAKLDTAPGFSKDKWPDLNAPAWRTDLDRFYGVRRTSETAGTGDVITQQRAVRLSKVLDQNVRTVADEKLGEVEDVVIDPRNARIAYLVVSTGGFLGMGEKMHAIPWEAARAKTRTDKDNDDLIVNVTKERLQKAPEFKKDDWNRMTDPAYMSELYTYYGSRPYWSNDTRSTKPSDTDKDRRDDKDTDPH